MNKELLSKLRKQSKVDPKEIVKAIANNDSAVVEHWLEKFAELIVRECADISNQAEKQCQHPGTQILKHFGVEE